MPLTTFSIDTYGNDECTVFKPKIETNDKRLTEKKCKLIAQMHKAISIIQFKLEGQLYNKHPEWKMDDRKLLDKIDF